MSLMGIWGEEGKDGGIFLSEAAELRLEQICGYGCSFRCFLTFRSEIITAENTQIIDTERNQDVGPVANFSVSYMWKDAAEHCSPTCCIVKIKPVGQKLPWYLISFPRPLPSTGERKHPVLSLLTLHCLIKPA